MERRGFFARMVGAVAALFGVPVVAGAAQTASDSDQRVRFKLETSLDGTTVWLSPVLSHVIDESTRRQLVKPISDMIDAIHAKRDSHPVDHRRRTDPEGIALNQAATTLVELKLALIRKYPW